MAEHPFDPLLQAVIDEDFSRVSAIVDAHPRGWLQDAWIWRDAPTKEDPSSEDDCDNLNADDHPFILAIGLDFDQAALFMLEREPALATRRYYRTQRTALMRAAFEGNMAMLRALMPFSDPLATDASGDSALSLAACASFVDAVEFLLPVSDLSLVDHYQHDLAEIALFCHRDDAFNAAERVAPRGGHLALEGFEGSPKASRRDRLACFRLLAPRGARLSTQTCVDGEPWICRLFSEDRAAMLPELIERKPLSIQEAGAFLAIAAFAGALACAQVLLPWANLHEGCPELVFVDKALHGRLPLEIAIEAESPHVADALLRADPSLASTPGLDGWPHIVAMAIGCKSSDWRSLARLLPHAPLGAVDSSGVSALDFALSQANFHGMAMIWDAMRQQSIPADPLALACAIESDNPEVLSWLLKHCPLSSQALRIIPPGKTTPPLAILIARKLWPQALLLLKSDPQNAIADCAAALGAFAQAQGGPKALGKALARAAQPWLCQPASASSPLDAFEISCAQDNPRAAKILAKAILNAPQRPAGWETKAWRALARSKARGKRWREVAALFNPWLQSLGQQSLDKLLVKACSKAWPLGAKTLLDCGADPGAQNLQRRSCAQLALSRPPSPRVAKTVKALLGAGADPLDSGAFPLDHAPIVAALRREHRDAFDAMRDALKEPLPQAAIDVLLPLAVQKGQFFATQSILALIPRDASWPRDARARCPLMLACAAGDSSLVELLAPLAPQPLATDACGQGALAIFLASRAWNQKDEAPERALNALLSRPQAVEALGPASLQAAQSEPRQWSAIQAARLRQRERAALMEHCALGATSRGAARI